jgi:beta-galactosidase
MEYRLNVEFHLAKETSWAPAGHVVAWEEFALPFEKKVEPMALDSMPPLRVKRDESDGKARIEGKDFAVTIDLEEGLIVSWFYRGTELIHSGPRLDLWRAPTDNDRGNKMPVRCAVWRDVAGSWERKKHGVETFGSGAIRYVFHAWSAGEKGRHDLLYTIFGSGDIIVECGFLPGEGKLPEFPRFGMRMALPPGFERMTWYGRGPHESYWDRKTGARVGLYSGSVDEQWVDYGRPQENGNKTDVRWAAFENNQGIGLLVAGMPVLNVSARHYSQDEMENARHTHDMARTDAVIVHLDYKQTGVGGDNSWGARPHDWCTLHAKPYFYSFRLRPYSAESESPAALARREIHVEIRGGP